MPWKAVVHTSPMRTHGGWLGGSSSVEWHAQTCRAPHNDCQGCEPEETSMPRVGNKHFSYTKAGVKAAEKEREKRAQTSTKRAPRKRR